jgi:hypothetical protein
MITMCRFHNQFHSSDLQLELLLKSRIDFLLCAEFDIAIILKIILSTETLLSGHDQLRKVMRKKSKMKQKESDNFIEQ